MYIYVRYLCSRLFFFKVSLCLILGPPIFAGHVFSPSRATLEADVLWLRFH